MTSELSVEGLNKFVSPVFEFVCLVLVFDGQQNFAKIVILVFRYFLFVVVYLDAEA
jgi:hypothetical protein